VVWSRHALLTLRADSTIGDDALRALEQEHEQLERSAGSFEG
jgi:hypothetical protein